MKAIGHHPKYGIVYDSAGGTGGGAMIFVDGYGWVKNPDYATAAAPSPAVDAAPPPKYEYSGRGKDRAVTLTNPEDMPSYATFAKMPNGDTARSVYEAWDKALEAAAKLMLSYGASGLLNRFAMDIRALKTDKGASNG